MRLMMHAAYTLAAQGQIGEARALCNQHIASLTASLASEHYVRMYIESGGTDADAFFLHAMALASSHEPHIMLLPASPIFKKYHRDARWQTLVEKLRFTQP